MDDEADDEEEDGGFVEISIDILSFNGVVV